MILFNYCMSIFAVTAGVYHLYIRTYIRVWRFETNYFFQFSNTNKREIAYCNVHHNIVMCRIIYKEEHWWWTTKFGRFVPVCARPMQHGVDERNLGEILRFFPIKINKTCFFPPPTTRFLLRFDSTGSRYIADTMRYVI